MGALLVASGGGHLRELHRLRPRLPIDGERVTWVTNDSDQSRALLSGEEVVFVPEQASRNFPATLSNLARARRVVAGKRFNVAVSTGSAIALSFLPVAAAHGTACHYIESGTRVRSPSMTGRLLRWAPGVHCYAQHRYFAAGSWRYAGSVLEGFEAVARPPAPMRRVLVTLGTWRQSFRALLDRLVEILPSDVETVWQTGHTDVEGLGIRPRPWLSPGELVQELRMADVVISHAGMGATLDALEAGKLPVVVPRRLAAGEQIDDHQSELAAELARLRLAVASSVPDLSYQTVEAAAAWEVRQAQSLPRLQLHDRNG